MEEPEEISWNPALEELIASEGERANGLAWLHTECERRYSQLNVFIALPVICLSTINGFVSGSSSMMFGDPATASMGVGAVSLFTAILSTIGSFFAWAKRNEAHRISAIQYRKISKFIAVEMSLPKKERIRAKDMLKIVREQTERLLETSPAVPEAIILKYNTKFNKDIYKDISHPEITNGVHKVEINHHSTAQEDTPMVPKLTEISPKQSIKIGLEV